MISFGHTPLMPFRSQGDGEGLVVSDVHNLPQRSELGLKADVPAIIAASDRSLNRQLHVVRI